MLTIKQILLDDNIGTANVIIGLDKLTGRLEEFVQANPGDLLGKQLLSAAWELQARLFVAQSATKGARHGEEEF